MTPTYEQFQDAYAKSGLTLSDYDLALAKENPAAGFGIIQSKQDYANATTDAARALANENANAWRRTGGYSGGGDGSQYIPQLTPNGNDGITTLTNQMMNYQPFSYQSAPQFKDSYKPQYDKQLNEMVNYKDFSYDVNSDPLYAQYKEMYNREGQRAMENTLAEVSARTGGIASSYATSAAAQANNYYAQQLADKIPDLYQMAYQQYADGYNRKSNNVSALMGARNFDLGLYDTQLGQYNADRNFSYGVYSDDYNRLGTNLSVLLDRDNTEYSRGQDELNNQWREREDARSRLQTYLAAGGDLNNLPAELRAASGLSDAEINALALSMTPGVSGGRYYSSGKKTEDQNGNVIDYNMQVGKDLVTAVKSNPSVGPQLLNDNWNNLGYTERVSILQAMGYPNQTAIDIANGGVGLFNAYYGATYQPTIEEQILSADMKDEERAQVLADLYGLRVPTTKRTNPKQKTADPWFKDTLK